MGARRRVLQPEVAHRGRTGGPLRRKPRVRARRPRRDHHQRHPARYADHIEDNDPAYVLADVDSKRRILVRCEEEMLSGIPRLVHFAQQTLRELALPYADRDDYPKDLT
ncbi:DUF6221 family protein [Microbispora sp. NPDC088329]|uniref:DUF6221 family protein n=1 Tax=Microbispora sp. NPDC088329 TaxID=3154869 RepID=UPI00344628FB